MPILSAARPRLLIQLPSAALESKDAGLESVAPAGDTRPAWAAVAPKISAHPWDQAHRAVAEPAALGLESIHPSYAEPDFAQRFPFRDAGRGFESFARPGPCEYVGPQAFWPWPDRGFAWHLLDEYSGLRAARLRVVSLPAGASVSSTSTRAMTRITLRYRRN